MSLKRAALQSGHPISNLAPAVDTALITVGSKLDDAFCNELEYVYAVLLHHGVGFCPSFLIQNHQGRCRLGRRRPRLTRSPSPNSNALARMPPHDLPRAISIVSGAAVGHICRSEASSSEVQRGYRIRAKPLDWVESMPVNDQPSICPLCITGLACIGCSQGGSHRSKPCKSNSRFARTVGVRGPRSIT